MSEDGSDTFEHRVARALGSVPGVEAVNLGGSRAYGGAGPGSDWDFAIYYREAFDPDALKALGWAGEVFPIGGWGGGVFNGGAWLTVEGHRVDVHYRDLADIAHHMDEARHGRFDIEHLAFHVAGVPTYIVLAEIALSRTVVGHVPEAPYPDALREAASSRWQEHAEMTLGYARTLARRGLVAGVAGQLGRAIVEEAHSRAARAGIWVTNEKMLLERVPIPGVHECLARLGGEPEALEDAVAGVASRLRGGGPDDTASDLEPGE